MTKWVTVKIPANLVDQIDEKLVGKKGYTSRGDVIRDAVRRLLEAGRPLEVE